MRLDVTRNNTPTRSLNQSGVSSRLYHNNTLPHASAKLSFLFFLSNYSYISDMSNLVRLQGQFVGEVVSLASQDCHKDVTLVCQDGQVRANSLLLVAVFPLIRRALCSVEHLEEDWVISLPDFLSNDLITFFGCLSEKTIVKYVGEDLKALTQNSALPQQVNSAVETQREENMGYKNEDKYEEDLDFADLDPLDSVKTEPVCNIKEQADFDVKSIEKEKIKRFTCKECGKGFSDRRRYNCHINNPSVHEEKSSMSEIVCECGYKTSRKADYKRHLITHEKKAKKTEQMEQMLSEYGGVCKDCGKTFTDSNKLLIHIKAVHQSLKVACDICGKFLRKNKINIHKNTVHADESAKIECEKCLKKFLPDGFLKHKCNRTEEPPKEICNICGKILGSTSMASHIKLVHGEVERRECHICGVRVKGSLKAHMRVHEEKQCCPECGIKVRDLKVHIDRVHTTDEQKKFHCQDCGKGFIRSADLENHRVNVHLKTYPHKCRYGCDVRYNDVNNRNSHERKKHGGVFKLPNQ